MATCSVYFFALVMFFLGRFRVPIFVPLFLTMDSGGAGSRRCEKEMQEEDDNDKKIILFDVGDMEEAVSLCANSVVGRLLTKKPIHKLFSNMRWPIYGVI